jgi:hypothetical protein
MSFVMATKEATETKNGMRLPSFQESSAQLGQNGHYDGIQRRKFACRFRNSRKCDLHVPTTNHLAEREGFEPPIAFRLCLISSQVHSTGLCHLSASINRSLQTALATRAPVV